MRRRILIVDDQINTLKVIAAILTDEGYDVFSAKSAMEALKIFEEQGDMDVVLADLRMPGKSGLDLYRKIRVLERSIPFVIMTAHGTIESAVQAMKEGVTNYLIKPINYEELSIVLEKAIREKDVTRELADLRKEIKGQYSFQNIIGSSRKMRRIFDILRTVAPTDAPVLILGETGTGKELLAKAMHALSQRQDRNMVCINSAALTETLLEAELFGYVKGAFTGATMNKKGRFEAADKGTLFLDEIGQMSLKIQSKLLRFLQEGTFEPVGSVETRKVNVRVISASNRDLEEEIKAGRFLSDLFYRIEVISMTLPPLRERIEDIPLLADTFIRRYAKQYEKDVEGISAQAVEGLMRHHWPGNVRELENCIARAVILCGKRRIELEDFSMKIKSLDRSFGEKTPKSFLRDIPEKGVTIKEIEQELIEKTLEKCLGNKSLAAELMGISRKALYEKLDRYSLSV